MSYRIHSWKSLPWARVRSVWRRPGIPERTLSLTSRHVDRGPVRQVANPIVKLLKRLEHVSVDLEDCTQTECLYLQRKAVVPELA